MTSTTPEFDLECRGLTKVFSDFTAVNRIDFTVPKGSFFSILGPSGCGKTTLLRMLAGFEQPDSGEIFIKGKSVKGIPPNKRPVNMVFQHLALFPNMSVAQNIAYGLKRRKEPTSVIDTKVGEVLERVGLAGSGAKQINQLSGGQKQRIAIARCLVLNPDVLLLDEPLGALDLKLREQMKVELKHLQQEFGTTFVYITHDQSEALVMSDQVAVMNNGRFEQVGTPQELYYQPATAFVAKFVGETNHLTGRITHTDNGILTIQTDVGSLLTKSTGSYLGADIHVGEQVDVFIRPEAVSLTFPTDALVADNLFQVTVQEVLFDGARSQAMVKTANGQAVFSVLLPQTAEYRAVKPGEKLQIHWSRGQASCLKGGVSSP